MESTRCSTDLPITTLDGFLLKEQPSDNEPTRNFDQLEGITSGEEPSGEIAEGLLPEDPYETVERVATGEDPLFVAPPADPNELPALMPLGEALHLIKDPEWVVEGLIAKGMFLVMAGKPKLSRKTILSQYLSIQIALGAPVFGLPVRKPMRVAVLNLEDGLQQTLRRYRDFGVKPGDPIPIELLANEDKFWEAIELIKQSKPDVVIIDPLMELEVLMGVKNENNSNEMGSVLKMLRVTLARKLNCAVILIHHFGTKGDRARGSSALQGSPDGWIDVRFSEKIEGYRMSWWLRYAMEGHVDVKIAYVPGNPGSIDIDILKAPVFGDAGEFKKKKDDGGEGPSGPTVDAYTKVCACLQKANEPLTKEMIREKTSLKNSVVSELIMQLKSDNLIEKVNRRWQWIAGAEHNAAIGSTTLSPSARDFLERELEEEKEAEAAKKLTKNEEQPELEDSPVDEPSTDPEV